MPTEYFFISDIHIGDDGELRNCDFEVELIERKLSSTLLDWGLPVASCAGYGQKRK